jgi:hypothetical protein
VNLNMKIATTFYGKTNQNTRVLRMRCNTFPHTKVRGSVDARNSKWVDLD